MSDTISAFAAYLREERMLRPSTTAKYVRVVTDFAAFLAADCDAGPATVEAGGKDALSRFLRREASSTGLPSRVTWNARLSALRAYYGYLVSQGVVTTSPAQQIARQRVHTHEPLPLTLDEVIRLVDVAESSSRPAQRARNVAIVKVLFHTSLRVAELASLDVTHLDFENYEFHEVRTKGDKRLSLPFNDVVAEALEGDAVSPA